MKLTAVLLLFVSVFVCPLAAQSTVVANKAVMDRLFVEVFNPIRRHITTAYPVPSLRQKFVNAMMDQSVTLSLASRESDVHGRGLSGRGPLAFSGSRPDDINKPAVVVVYENFVDRMNYASTVNNSLGYADYVEDIFLAMYLHEYYHIKQQGMWRGNNTTTQIVKFEEECWAMTVKDVLLPMQQSGRGRLLPGTFEETIVNLYNKVGGNISDPRWHQLFLDNYGK